MNNFHEATYIKVFTIDVKGAVCCVSVIVEKITFHHVSNYNQTSTFRLNPPTISRLHN